MEKLWRRRLRSRWTRELSQRGPISRICFRSKASLPRWSPAARKHRLRRIRSKEQIEELSKGAHPGIKESLERLDKELNGLLTGAEKSANSDKTPGLDDIAAEAGSLYAQVGQADAAPTLQEQAKEHASGELSAPLKNWARRKSSAVPDLNHQLHAAPLPELNLERRPENMPEGGDED